MNQYNFLDKILHEQFLGNNALSNFCYKRILSKSLTENEVIKSSNIFITGLARSGTTALLNKFYATEELGSFLYKFMPFILLPELAKIASSSKDNIPTRERFHSDGIKINLNSPECLDEVFWIKSTAYCDYKEFLKPIIVENKTLTAYNYLIEKFKLIQGKNRMLIKNNNNHLRLRSLLEYFKDSYFLFIYRDPIHHANSLLNQHLNFINLQREDKFILNYMNLIGHFEFGAGVKSFIYKANEKEFYKKNKLNINYWLNQWVKTHKWILEENFANYSNFILISYEDLCSNEINLYKKLCDKVKISNFDKGVVFNSSNKTKNFKDIETKLLNTSARLYDQLKKISFK